MTLTRNEIILGAGVSLSFILLCLAHILLLPPYEGFDETAHYSYISILSDRHEVPDFRSTPLDATVENDRIGLPRPYGAAPAPEVNGGITYSEFFADAAAQDREEAIRKFWHKPQRSVVYTPDIPARGVNWQGQHPPLYYLLLDPPYRVARFWSPGVRLLFLRLCSVFLACGSLVFWLKTIPLFQSAETRRFLLLAGVSVIFFPSLFYDLSRLGNDSLLTLLFAASLYFLLSTYVHRQERLTDFVKLAVTLGLGLLTKLFFLPLWGGAILSSLWLGVKVTKLGLKPLLLRVLLLVGLPLLLAGWWFGLFYSRYDVVVGSDELYAFRSVVSPPQNDLTNSQFFAQLFSVAKGFVTTFLWCGSWSWVRPPRYLYACFVPLLGLTVYGLILFVRGPKQTEKRQIMILATLLVIPLLPGFLYHMYLRVVFTGVGAGTGGYYLFFAWPVIGMFFAFAFEAQKTNVRKLATLAAFAFLLFFDLTGWWRSALVYSGFLRKVGEISRGVGWIPPTTANMLLVHERLQMLVFPWEAIILYTVAFVLRLAIITWVIFPHRCSTDDREAGLRYSLQQG
jgi:hypothetical protein